MQNTTVAPIMPYANVVRSQIGMFDATNGSQKSQNPIGSKLHSEHGALIVN